MLDYFLECSVFFSAKGISWKYLNGLTLVKNIVSMNFDWAVKAIKSYRYCEHYDVKLWRASWVLMLLKIG